MALTDLVAEEIRAMMARRRITGQQMARQLGVSNAWVSYRLNGKQAIDLNDLERIAGVLEVDVQDLLPEPDELAERRGYRRRAGIRSSSWLLSGASSARNVARPPKRSDFTRPGDGPLAAAA